MLKFRETNVIPMILFLLLFLSASFLQAQTYWISERGGASGGFKIASLNTMHYSRLSTGRSLSTIMTGAEIAWEVRSHAAGLGGELSVGYIVSPERNRWLTNGDSLVDIQIDYGLSLGKDFYLTPLVCATLGSREFAAVNDMYYNAISHLSLGGGLEINHMSSLGMLSLGIQYSQLVKVLNEYVFETGESYDEFRDISLILGYSFFL